MTDEQRNEITRMATLETNFSNINDDLKEIKTAITRSTIWLITTLLTIIVASFSLAFWLGTWKGALEVRLENLERERKANAEEILNLRSSIQPTIDKSIDNFAQKNFIEYNK